MTTTEVKLMRVYLDMCCYNRPYDDQSQLKVAMEAEFQASHPDAH